MSIAVNNGEESDIVCSSIVSVLRSSGQVRSLLYRGNPLKPLTLVVAAIVGHESQKVS